MWRPATLARACATSPGDDLAGRGEIDITQSILMAQLIRFAPWKGTRTRDLLSFATCRAGAGTGFETSAYWDPGRAFPQQSELPAGPGEVNVLSLKITKVKQLCKK